MAFFTAKDQKIAMTSSNEVFFPKSEDYSGWKEDVQTYVQ
jgi:hypothetical protein